VGQGITGVNYTATGDCTVATPALISGGIMGSGEVDTVTILATSCNDKSSGQSFSTTLTVKYVVTVAGNDVAHTETGTIRGVAE